MRSYIICTADITEDYIAIPRGCEDALCNLLDEANVSYAIKDKTNSGETILVAFNGELREEQQPAADALLEQNTGVLSAATAFGKTEVQVYDYVDIHIPVLERMYQKRMKSYSSIGYKTKLLTNGSAAPNLIYDGKTFYPKKKIGRI